MKMHHKRLIAKNYLGICDLEVADIETLDVPFLAPITFESFTSKLLTL